MVSNDAGRKTKIPYVFVDGPIDEEEEKVPGDGNNRSESFSGRSISQSASNFMVRNCDCKPRILVVDDTAFNIQILQMMIQQQFNFETDIAQNGEIAVKMFTDGFEKSCECPDRAYRLIFMDI